MSQLSPTIRSIKIKLSNLHNAMQGSSIKSAKKNRTLTGKIKQKSKQATTQKTKIKTSKIKTKTKATACLNAE